MIIPDAAFDLLRWTPSGEYQWFRDRGDDKWGVACYEKGSTTPKAIVAVGMDKTLAGALTVILNEYHNGKPV